MDIGVIKKPYDFFTRKSLFSFFLKNTDYPLSNKYE
ncbi:hypothetical protein HP10700_01809 [Helicobacter pylori 10700]|nr:hypothetical protein HP10700_01809 [Helicobacter pylori 10700]